MRGGFGHSSTYDQFTGKIFVFGGTVATSYSENLLVDWLYAYDPKKESWYLLIEQGQIIYNYLYF